jgi:hypothetical protein
MQLAHPSNAVSPGQQLDRIRLRESAEDRELARADARTAPSRSALAWIPTYISTGTLRATMPHVRDDHPSVERQSTSCGDLIRIVTPALNTADTTRLAHVYSSVVSDNEKSVNRLAD